MYRSKYIRDVSKVLKVNIEIAVGRYTRNADYSCFPAIQTNINFHLLVVRLYCLVFFVNRFRFLTPAKRISYFSFNERKLET